MRRVWRAEEMLCQQMQRRDGRYVCVRRRPPICFAGNDVRIQRALCQENRGPDTGWAFKVIAGSEFFVNDPADSCYRRRQTVLREVWVLIGCRDLSEVARPELFRAAQSARGVTRARELNPSPAELKVGNRVAAIESLATRDRPDPETYSTERVPARTERRGFRGLADARKTVAQWIPSSHITNE